MKAKVKEENFDDCTPLKRSSSWHEGYAAYDPNRPARETNHCPYRQGHVGIRDWFDGHGAARLEWFEKHKLVGV